MPLHGHSLPTLPLPGKYLVVSDPLQVQSSALELRIPNEFEVVHAAVQHQGAVPGRILDQVSVRVGLDGPSQASTLYRVVQGRPRCCRLRVAWSVLSDDLDHRLGPGFPVKMMAGVQARQLYFILASPARIAR